MSFETCTLVRIDGLLMVRKLLAKKASKNRNSYSNNKCQLVVNVAECQATISITVHSALSRPFV